ncbi:SDR family NAD(P)-dependent oxidoreductase [Streptomyces sp. NBC_00069]|uniref:SDR family NAD(P)-dependent oxidoreductase n=1 Tax=Streptomyces sp. NBC_00069 TaxID=2975639 RepID=UPI0032506405
MDLHLTDKVAVVTGASKGIGLAVTRALAGEGARVVAAARTVSGPLTELAAGGRVRPVAVDLTSPDGPEQAVREAVAAFGGLDILVNNVGAVRPRLGGFLSLTDEDWAWALTINFLTAVRRRCRAASRSRSGAMACAGRRSTGGASRSPRRPGARRRPKPAP